MPVVDDYQRRLQEHVGRTLDDVVAEFARRGVEPPGWIVAMKALRDASERTER